VLAIVDPCHPYQTCSGMVEASNDAGRSWRRVGRAPAGYGTPNELLIATGTAIVTTGPELLIGGDRLRKWTRTRLPAKTRAPSLA
jgi:hypothetical protein